MSTYMEITMTDQTYFDKQYDFPAIDMEKYCEIVQQQQDDLEAFLIDKPHVKEAIKASKDDTVMTAVSQMMANAFMDSLKFVLDRKVSPQSLANHSRYIHDFDRTGEISELLEAMDADDKRMDILRAKVVIVSHIKALCDFLANTTQQPDPGSQVDDPRSALKELFERFLDNSFRDVTKGPKNLAAIIDEIGGGFNPKSDKAN